ncbi:MAG: His/Gly/Thr/Pro-type tRNA ligase C-terminal domain-containing protein, partial [Nitrospirota bacterium]
AVAAGGRYDSLVEEVGGPPTPGIGFAIGVERLLTMLPETGDGLKPPQVYIAAIGDDATRKGQLLADELRKCGIYAERDYSPGGLKNQMKKADRSGASLTVIIGEDEMAKGAAVLRDMKTREQAEVRFEKLVGEIEARARLL